LLIVEFTTLSVKLAHNGWKIEGAFVKIHQINTPLVGFGVIEPEGLRLYAKFVIGSGDIELFKICKRWG
jgi:hypothetical protein